MPRSRFDPLFRDLPLALPVFPLPGATVLPGTVLPLNIFEPRYVNLVNDALGNGRMFGMIQPHSEAGVGSETQDREPQLCRIGCAGRITSFSETADGRFLINLTGFCRFAVSEELPTVRGYRLVKPDWSAFEGDLIEVELDSFDRTQFMTSLRSMLDTRSIALDWDALEDVPAAKLVDLFSTQLPLSETEKQALVEAPTVAERAALLEGFAQMESVASDPSGPDVRH